MLPADDSLSAGVSRWHQVSWPAVV